MSFLVEPKGYTPAELGVFVESLTWQDWQPRFVTLHNTGVPSLATWLDPAHRPSSGLLPKSTMSETFCTGTPEFTCLWHRI